MSARCWFITGVSAGGIGHAIAQAALSKGDIVYGTLRRKEQAAEFQALAPGRAHALLMDVTQPQQIAQAVADAGTIDVLVNNAGVGMVAALEETSPAEARALFESNVFGALQVIQAVLPQMRRRRAGRIINISSGVGLFALPGMALYSASKFALEGLTEALAGEVAALGIHVTAVEPGAILSNFVGPNMREAETKLPDYAQVSGHGRAGLAHYYESSASKPEAVAAAVTALADQSQPPSRCVVGADVQAALRMKFETMQSLLGG